MNNINSNIFLFQDSLPIIGLGLLLSFSSYFIYSFVNPRKLVMTNNDQVLNVMLTFKEVNVLVAETESKNKMSGLLLGTQDEKLNDPSPNTKETLESCGALVLNVNLAELQTNDTLFMDLKPSINHLNTSSVMFEEKNDETVVIEDEDVPVHEEESEGVGPLIGHLNDIQLHVHEFNSIKSDPICISLQDIDVNISMKVEPRNCYICMDDDNNDNDMLKLESCRHSAHLGCLKHQIGAGSSGKRISFGYMCCGECRVPLAHELLASELEYHHKIKEQVETLCVFKCLEDDAIQGLSDMIKQDETAAKALCVNKMSCFFCNACKSPFCGGLINCADDDALDASTLYCSSCAFESQLKAEKKHAHDWRGKCDVHGYKYAMYKCDSCCSLATFDCRSNHYCDRCHDQAFDEKNYPCPGLDLCPLCVEHPPNRAAVHGEVIPGFILGCFKCFTSFEGEVDLGNEDQWKDLF